MLKPFFILSYKNLRRRSLRSWITVLGIVISIATILTLVIVSESLENSITEQFEKMGSDRLFIMSPGGAPGTRLGLTEKDLEVVEKIPDFDYVVPYLFEPAAEVEYQRETAYTPVMGWPTENMDVVLEDYDAKLKEGRSFYKDEKYSAILGIVAAEDIFRKEIPVKSSILIHGVKFRVVGIFDDFGNPEDNKQIAVPLESLRDVTGKKDEISFMDAVVKEGRDINLVADKLERKLERSRDDDDFTVMKPEQVLQLMGQILGIVQGILISIALISLVVGAVSIMNIMFSAILERTKEIGIMKSVGARNSDILILFMIESGLIGFAGGVLGILLGIAVSYIVAGFAVAAGLTVFKIHISPFVILGVLAFAFLIGMLSGAIPARRAAYLHPVDALRWSS